MVKKGRAAVDSHCPIAATSHVLEEGDDIWDCMLNQVGEVTAMWCCSA